MGTLGITNNYIKNNSKYHVENRSVSDINARQNWWGTIDVAEINRKIYDKQDDIKYGKVLYSPLKMSESGPLNHVPVVSVLVDSVIGRVPMEVTFTATAHDSDGTVDKYEWDFDGDGTYDWSSVTNGNTSYTYNDSGKYPIELKVTDDKKLANRIFYKIATLDFGINAEQQGNKVVIEWGWGKFQTILIPPSALTSLDENDEVHVFDSAGIKNNICPV